MSSPRADDATAPSIILENDRATEGDGDDCGIIYFRASDDGDATFDAVTILAEANDVTADDEAGKLTIDVEMDDTATEMLKLVGNSGASKGTGEFEINADTADIDVHIDGDEAADLFVVRILTLATALRSIDGTPLKDLEVEGDFQDDKHKCMSIIDNMQLAIVEKLYDEYNSLLKESDTLLAGDKIKN